MNKNRKIEENWNPDGTFAKGYAFRSIPKEGLTQLILQI